MASTSHTLTKLEPLDIFGYSLVWFVCESKCSDRAPEAIQLFTAVKARSTISVKTKSERIRRALAQVSEKESISDVDAGARLLKSFYVFTARFRRNLYDFCRNFRHHSFIAFIQTFSSSVAFGERFSNNEDGEREIHTVFIRIIPKRQRPSTLIHSDDPKHERGLWGQRQGWHQRQTQKFIAKFSLAFFSFSISLRLLFLMKSSRRIVAVCLLSHSGWRGCL